jgi:outer membrane immunogenic protein
MRLFGMPCLNEIEFHCVLAETAFRWLPMYVRRVHADLFFWEINMRRIIAGSIAIASLLATVGAFAADLPARTYTKAPAIVDPGYNWTGFYAGLNGGYSWGRSRSSINPGAPFAVTSIGHNVDGGLGGGQIGYNWQLDRTWVVGLEADIQGTGERGRSVDQLGTVRVGAIGLTLSNASSTDFPWFATFRGRVGILADPSLLLYATGGLAVGEVRFASQPTAVVQLFDGGSNVPIGPPVTVVGVALSERQTHVGWTAGAGLEKKFNRNWSAKLEYLYIDLGSHTYFGGTANATNVSFSDHIVRAGFNYQFTQGPVVAKH